jgi:uncharacterized radical SAM superfamily Fe-S cluster-containing enzyme
LPKTVESLCPEPGCGRVIDARLFAEDGKVFMEKTCPEHGYVKDLYWSDVELFLKAERWEFGDFRGLSNPFTTGEQCPRDCGPCQKHTSHTALGNIDLTNRCNLTCPICFANANVTGSVYEPTREQIKDMLRLYRKEAPVKGRVVQFSGGEPTIHPEFFDILRDAQELGFAHQQIASNGIRLSDPDFAARAAEAGLHTVYLQFDGLDNRVYTQLRGRPLLDIKMKAVESIRRAGMKIVFVPTIAKTINDDQVVPILRFAIENIDVTSGISYQPVALTGRVSHEERRRLRYTIPDLAHAISAAGYTDTSDWYPLSLVSPISKFITAMREEPAVHITCHPHCSLGTYLAIEPQGQRAVPITRFIDVEGMFTSMDQRAGKMSKSRFKIFQKAGAFYDLHSYFKPEGAPEGMDFTKFVHTLQGLLDKNVGRGPKADTYKMLLVAGMHFMDGYNYELERVRRCVIHYATPAGRVIPFCAYNSGLYLREPIEQQYSVPMAEYKRQRAAQA